MKDTQRFPVKVLHIIQGKHFGGAEQVVLTLTKCCDRNRVAPAVVCLSDGLLLKKLTNAGIPNFLMPMKTKRDILIPVIKTIRLIKQRNIDIIHTHTVRSNLIGRLAALFSRRKCVTQLHSPILRDFANLKRSRFNEIVDSITRPIANRYIAVSYSLRHEMIKRGMPSHMIVTIHNALDLEPLNTSINPDKKEGIRKEYNIPENAIVLVLVALLRPRKGIEVIIRAMKSILKQNPDVYLIIVGNDDISEDPDYGNNLRTLASEISIEQKVIFTGFRNDVPAILRQSNLMVLPSLFGEGLPMVILEAMALGVPVVASNIEGVPEIIEDGVNGFLVNPGDVKQLSTKIVQVLNAPILLRNVAKVAQEKVINEMDGYRQAHKIEKVYREVLAC